MDSANKPDISAITNLWQSIDGRSPIVSLVLGASTGRVPSGMATIMPCLVLAVAMLTRGELCCLWWGGITVDMVAGDKLALGEIV